MPDLTPNQRKAVESRNNTVVTAGAGSGKTLVLALRYLHLIRTGAAEVGEILTLTFTRKAAAEMYSRIHGMLLEERDDPRVAKALRGFDTARISTLDAFSATLARDRAELFGMSPDFAPDEDVFRDLTRSSALRFAMDERIRFRPLLDFFPFDRLVDDLLVPLAAEYPLAVEPDFAAILAVQERRITDVLNLAERDLGALADNLTAFAGLGEAKVDGYLAAFESLPPEGSFTREPKAVLAWIAAYKLKPFTAGVKQAEKVAAREVMVAVGEVIQRITPALAWLSMREMHADCAELFDEYLSVIADAKRRSGAVTFADVASMAVAALRDDRAYRRFHKRSVRYVMIDEFQDNNALQRDLLFLLAEREGSESPGIPPVSELDTGKLFFVGDEKQSIYRFRGADVSVFKGLQSDLGGAPIFLDTNFRSEPSLVDFFNGIFPGVFGPSEEPYEARFETLTPRGLPAAPLPLELLYGNFVETPDLSSGRVQSEAFAIVQWIREALENPSKFGRDSLAPEDVAILMRSTGAQREYERMLRFAGIPYQTPEPRSMFLEAPVNDLYNYLQLVAYPDDRLSYAAVLRSPFVNLGDDGLARVLLAKGGLFEPVEGLSADDERRLVRAMGTYRRLRELAIRSEPAELVDYLWFDAGYRYHLLADPANHPYLEFYPFLTALALSPRGSGKGLTGFLDFLRNNLGKFERLPDVDVLKSRPSGVHLMTIHKSKGLEFPVVVVADMGNTGRNRSDNRLFGTHEGFALKLPHAGGKKTFFEAEQEEAEKAMSEAELKRLLYVAMTRAEDYCLLAGTHHRGNRTGSRSLLNLFAAGVGLEPESLGDLPYAREIRPVTREEILERSGSAITGGLRGMAGEYRRPATRIAVRREYPVTYLNERYAELRRLDGDTLTEAAANPGPWTGLAAPFGTLCHAVLEYRMKGVYAREIIPDDVTSPFPPERLNEAFRDAEKLAEGFFRPMPGSPLEGMGTAVKEPEVPFLYSLEGTGGPYWLSGVMDLVVRDETRCVVIDYKSDARLEPDHYAPQLEIYRLAAEALFGVPVECYLYSLLTRDFIPAPPPGISAENLLAHEETHA